MREKNRTVEFFRFLFCCIIFILHFRSYGEFPTENGYFNGGYLGTEYFFILSGFLMMRKFEECTPCAPHEEGKAAFRFLLNRIKKLYPYYLIAVVAHIAGNAITKPSFSVKAAVLKGFPDIFALQIFWRPYNLSTHFWFVSALLWASFIVYYLLLVNKDRFIYIIGPLSLFLYIGIVYRRFQTLDLTANDVLWISGIRAFVEIGLGCSLFYLYRSLVERGRFLHPVVYTALELFFLAVILIIMYRTRRDYKDFIMIFLIAAFLLLCFLQRGYLTLLLDNRVSAFLGSLSYPMYLNQMFINSAAEKYLPHYSFWVTAGIRLVLIATLSWIELAILKRVRRRINRGSRIEQLKA